MKKSFDTTDFENLNYWLLGDDQLPLSKDYNRKFDFLSYFKHSLLFNPNILFSDSMAINNPNFSLLIEESSSFRELINPETFSIAVRESHEEEIDLREIKRRFVESGKYRVPQLSKSYDGVDFLHNSSRIIKYSMEKIAMSYATDSVELFENKKIRAELGEDLSKFVYDLAHSAREKEKKNFGRNFFFYDLPDILRKNGKYENIDHLIDLIKKFSSYPYVTALPNSINVSAVYANEHKDAFNILGSKYYEKSLSGDIDYESIPLQSGLSGFSKGISLLSPNDIKKLRESDEGITYFEKRRFLDSYDVGKMQKNFHEALSNYIRRIDCTIVQNYRNLENPDGVLGVTFNTKEKFSRRLANGIEAIPDIFTYVTIAAGIASSSGVLPLFLSSISEPPQWLNLFLVMPVIKSASRFITGRSSEEFTIADNNLENMKIHDLRNIWTSETKIDSEISIFHNNKLFIPSETLYTNTDCKNT